MFDYKLIEAFAAVITEQGFEKASLKLNITQSAISQRIKLLEEQTGQVLIVRSTPPKATVHGKKLLKHFQMVAHLENELNNDFFYEEKSDFRKISVGVNADSLATWFMDICYSFLDDKKYIIDIRVDDQDETDKMLKNGEVSGCIGSKKIFVQGCKTVCLGKMKYRAAASKTFVKKYFKKGFTLNSVEKAPLVLFNRKDRLHDNFLKMVFEREILNLPSHFIPSSEKFLEFILKGYAYGIVPEHQAEKFFENGSLLQLTEITFDVPLYWNCWNIKSEIIDDFTKTLLKNTKKELHDIDK
jgi:LysR family transcriptional regulator (chromosome initiation inhibitor)